MGRVGVGVSTCAGDVIGPVWMDADGRAGRRDPRLGLAVSASASSIASAVDAGSSSWDGDVIGPVVAGLVTAGCEGVAYGSIGTAVTGGLTGTCGVVLGDGSAYGSIGYALGGGPATDGSVALGGVMGV